MQHGMGELRMQPANVDFVPTPLFPSSAKVIVKWGVQQKLVPHVMEHIMQLAQQLAQPSSQHPTVCISKTTPSIDFEVPLYSTTMAVG
jgi:hypothetical protein